MKKYLLVTLVAFSAAFAVSYSITAFKQPAATFAKSNITKTHYSAPVEPYRVAYPKDYHGQTVPLVIWFHGSGPLTNNEKLLDTLESVYPNTDALTDAGYMVATSNAHGGNLDNELSQNDYIYLYRYLKQEHNIGSVYFWSSSMGGIDSLLTLRRREIPVKAYVGMSPVTNTDSVYNNPHLSGYLYKAWHGAPSKLNPIKYQDYPKIPYFFFASYDDTYVIRSENLDLLNVPNKQVVDSYGDHPDLNNFVRPKEIVGFLNSIEQRK